MTKEQIEQQIEVYRKGLQSIGEELMLTKLSVQSSPLPVENSGEDRGETIANIILAYRHIEDARMRLGKVYQALNGGISNSER